MDLLILLWISLIIFIIFSPHSFINFKDFISSINYESEVALGKSTVFYTRQFTNTKFFYFQLTKIFPYALGWPTFVLGSLGLIGLPWRDKKINLLRYAFLIYFIPSAMIYAKWNRFMAPVLPIIITFAILFLQRIKVINFIKIIIIIFAIIPGIAYLSIYQNPDVRFQASDWIYKNIPERSQILFETANVVDIPIIDQRSRIKDQKPIEKFYKTVSFNFYDLDISSQLQIGLQNYINETDYIIIPSRRIFANHPKEKYPLLNQYYEDLYSGKLGFKKVAEFHSYPRIELLGRTLLEFPDEEAEETWTVFDHPVIRIYKKVK